MTNETTASQPKSIGDDAQFRNALSAWYRAKSGASRPQKVERDFAALIAAIDNFRAPAAQASAPGSDLPCGQCSANQFLHNVCVDIFPALRNAGHLTLVSLLEVALRDLPVKASATIQAAPEGLAAKVRAIAEKWNSTAIKEGFAGNEVAYELLAALGDFDDAATIQEPVMVAEPVQVVVSLGDTWADSCIVCQQRGEFGIATQKGPDGCREAVESGEIYCAEHIGDAIRPTLAAPMVADPAGVVVDAKFWPQGPTQIACSSCGLTAGESRVLDALKRGEMAATVKAVPSEALDTKRLDWLMANNSDYSVKIRGQEKYGWFIHDPWRDISSSYFSTSREAIDAAIAAPLADKTGGGE